MPTVALATCRELPHLDSDELFLVDALQARGIEARALPWDGPDDAFLAHKLTVIRSTWDYTARVDEFVAWAQRLELAHKQRGGDFKNPASVVRWNTHKRYLEQLASEGVATVPTAVLSAGPAPVDLAALLRERGFVRGAVVKPAVSAGSRDTVRVFGAGHARATESLAAAQALVNELGPARDLLVQPFVEGIARGEVSLIYIDGAFSHAINKVPLAGDFRSQPEFGSHVTPIAPSKAQRAAADDALAVAGGRLLYARVDLVEGDGGAPWLIELELVEPSLYLAHDPQAAHRLADAIARSL